jgi:hypothetical protein
MLTRSLNHGFVLGVSYSYCRDHWRATSLPSGRAPGLPARNPAVWVVIGQESAGDLISPGTASFPASH